MSAEWFAGRLRELREQAGLTQDQLADKAGMTRDGIAHFEQGRRKPSWESVLALSAALGVSVEAFTVPPQTDTAPRPRGRPRKDGEQAAKGKAAKGRKRKGG